MSVDVGNEIEGELLQPQRYIRCPDCGEQIMMVPVLSQMIEAIENHLATHDAHVKPDLAIPQPKVPNIRDDLNVQVLQRAAEIGSALNKNPIWINTE
jgi:DNA-directed RNA polymerase subunit RPC12/RpoP